MSAMLTSYVSSLGSLVCSLIQTRYRICSDVHSYCANALTEDDWYDLTRIWQYLFRTKDKGLILMNH